MREGDLVATSSLPTQTDIDRKVGGAQGGPGTNTTPPNQDGQRQRFGGVGSAQGVPGKKTPPITRTNRDSGAVVSGVGGAQGSSTQTESLTGAAQDEVSEEVVKLAVDRTGLTSEVEAGQGRKKRIDLGDGEK